MTIKEQIRKTISVLSCSDIRGCITGSSMIDGDYDSWDSVPDVDLFVYNENQLLYAVDYLMMVHHYYPASKGEQWKIDKSRNRSVKKNVGLQTIKLKHKDTPDVIVNVTWKDKRDNLFAVLSSFDMSIIMVGLDIPTKVCLDLRTGHPGMVIDDPNGVWSTSPKVAVPNPLREQKVDMYGAEMWIRQFSRCIKYWDRGYDTRPMAVFYVKLIDQVIEDGQLFSSEASKERYEDFVEEFTPVRQQMLDWLKSKED